MMMQTQERQPEHRKIVVRADKKRVTLLERLVNLGEGRHMVIITIDGDYLDFTQLNSGTVERIK